jgi:hypothetical protein
MTNHGVATVALFWQASVRFPFCDCTLHKLIPQEVKDTLNLSCTKHRAVNTKTAIQGPTRTQSMPIHRLDAGSCPAPNLQMGILWVLIIFKRIKHNKTSIHWYYLLSSLDWHHTFLLLAACARSFCEETTKTYYVVVIIEVPVRYN